MPPRSNFNHPTEHPMNVRIRHHAFRVLSLGCAAVLAAGFAGVLPGATAPASAALDAPILVIATAQGSRPDSLLVPTSGSVHPIFPSSP